MDVQTGLIYVAVVVISALVIGFVSVMAMKEKSYEEAIAEQRKLPDDLLLGKKEKTKDKKHKNKTGKKVKEKKDEKEEKPEHVQFEETPQILSSEHPLQENGKGNKKKGKIEKVKPILLNKEDPTVVIAEPTPLQPVLTQEANHFEVIRPKDDLDLIRSHSRENLHHISPAELATNKSPKETPTKVKRSVKEKDEKKKKDDNKDEKNQVSSICNQLTVSKEPQIKEVKEKSKELIKEQKEIKESVKESLVLLQSANKESKKIKKKNDILAQIGGDRDGINFSLLNPLVQKAELSRSEIQFLIDQLLNKQQDNPQEHAEWTESRADPVIKLRKQLAEREKALRDEQDAGLSVQSKLLELRQELNAERARLSASVRQLEDAFSAKAAEAQTLHTRMQHILESHAAEKQGFSRQIEQLQAKVTEDAAIIVKMQEEQGQSQVQLQQELMAQRKQLELQFAQMRDQEAQLKAQLTQKHAELQEAQAVQLTLSQQLQSGSQELDMLRQQLMHVKESADRLPELRLQLEEARRAQADAEHRLKSLQKQATWLQSELEASKAVAAKLEPLKEEVAQLQAELAGSNVANSPSDEQLEAKEQELQEALSEMETVRGELRRAHSDLKKLEIELGKAQSELKMTKSELAKALDNHKLSQNDLIKCQDELRQIQQILAQTQSEFSKVRSAQLDELQILKLQEENERLAVQLGGVTELQKELKQLRENNESLTSQLATSKLSTEEARENGIEEIVQKNQVQLVENTNLLLAQKESQLTELKTALTQKEKELVQLGIQVESLRSEVNNQRCVTSKLQDDLEQQRSKNNDLRRKNWKVMEALNLAEMSVKNRFGATDDVQTLKAQEQETTKALLQRIFPEVKVSEKTYDQWIKAFEDQINTVFKMKTDLKSESVVSDLEKTNKNLQAMVNHYKQIIYDTEGMLNKLQSHIESEEKRWQSQLRQKENEVSNLRIKIHGLQNSSPNKELQQKISELESRLCEAESFRTKLQASHSQSQDPDFVILEQLQQEKARLSQQLQNESCKLANLDAEVSKLRSLVQTSESSLTQEKKLVSQLQLEMSQLKNEVYGDSSSSDQSTSNGPSVTDLSQSEDGSGKK